MMSSNAAAAAAESDAADTMAAIGLQDIAGSAAGVGEKETATTTTTSSASSSTCDRSWISRIDESIGRSRKIRGSNFVQLATVDILTHEPRCRTVVFRGFLRPEHLPAAWADHHGLDAQGGRDSTSSSCVMKMITDARSNKVVRESTSSSSSNAELVWWFGKTNEQYRVRGELVYVGGAAMEDDAVTAPTTTTEGRNNIDGRDDMSLLLARARQEQWANLSDKAREQFFWPEPGLPYRSSGEEESLPVGGRDETGRLLPPPPTFLLVLLRPRRCEYLRLTDNYRQIDELVVTTKSAVGGTGEDGMWTMQRVNP
jgi:pyridoxamine 5'-phosphate oxidase